MLEQYKQDPDRLDLIDAARGDRVAFGRLVRKHPGRLMRFARLLTTTEAEAEDVTQDAFLSAFRHVESYQGTGSVRAWLTTITRRSAYRLHRKRAGAPQEVLPFDDTLPLPNLGLAAGWGDAPDPEQLAAASERHEALLSALETLPEGDRAVLLLRDIEGFSGPEAAESLNISLATLKSRLHRARLRLMASLRGG